MDHINQKVFVLEQNCYEYALNQYFLDWCYGINLNLNCSYQIQEDHN
jgi:hypothetical protein